MVSWPKILASVALLACAFGAGLKASDYAWSEKWAKRDSDDSGAVLQLERENRAKDAQWYELIEGARNDGNERINAANAAVSTANAQSDRVRKSIDDYAARLIESQKRLSAAITAGGKAEPAGCGVLPELLKRSDSLAGVYAAEADVARARGLTCEQAYDAIKKAP